jgi:hypothetical protein
MSVSCSMRGESRSSAMTFIPSRTKKTRLPSAEKVGALSMIVVCVRRRAADFFRSTR